MKKFINIILCIFAFGNIHAYAAEQSFDTFVYDLNGKRTNDANVTISDLIFKKDNANNLFIEEKTPTKEINNEILSRAKDNENLLILDLKVDDSAVPYPETETITVNVTVPTPSGGRNFLGKDYRIIRYTDENESEDISENITESGLDNVRFTTDKLGKYVIFLNPAVYNVTFYIDEPIYDNDGNILNSDCIYSEIYGLKKNDKIMFPTIPEKDDCVFTGWKAYSGSGIYFTAPQPLTAISHEAYYASWCQKDEYKPIKLEISSNEAINKGEENGKKITLTTNYGVFVKDGGFPTNWRTAYEEETDEAAKADILTEWKSKWSIVGNDELLIENATRIDDKTVEFTLSGNSGDKYTDAVIYIEFDNSLLLPEPYELDDEIIDWADTKIKTDSDGVRAKMYRSDNAVALAKQNKPNTGGSGGLTHNYYTVTFNSDGGNTISTQSVSINTAVKEPEQPQKENYVFDGWFTDKELTQPFDFTEKITKNITLYAKWNEIDERKNQIILTVGENDTIVFGETVQNDVSPVIKNDIAFLPVRFVAERLGATVEWDEKTQTVRITKEDIEIILTVGSDTAFVNGDMTKLDYPPFIEKDRTYTPVRFIYEKLGCTVEWDEETQNITITR